MYRTIDIVFFVLPHIENEVQGAFNLLAPGRPKSMH